MIIRPWAEFSSDLPTDQVDGEGEILQFGGKSVAEAIVKLLGELGAKTSPPMYADEHGWEWDFYWKGRRLWGQVTLVGNYILIVEDPAWISKYTKRNKEIYCDAIMHLASALVRHDRFNNVSWYLPDDLLSGKPGAARPVGD